MRLTLKTPRPRTRWLILAALVAVAAVSGAALGHTLKLDLPDVRTLEDYQPPLMTRILDREGELVATFAEEKRILIPYSDFPPHLVDALVATEDSRFFDHIGIDVRGMARALLQDVREGRLAQGASTLTQQLARRLFLHPKKLWRRKFEEMVLALEIERQYSKEEILTFYCNQMYWGHGQYGLEAAAVYYFGKPAREMDLLESATLVGILQRPSALSPLVSMEAGLERRNHVLRRMVDTGKLGAEEAESLYEQPITLAQEHKIQNVAPYFVEEVRRWLGDRLDGESLYQAGLEVHSTLDVPLQRIANQAVDDGLRELDKRQGWRGPHRRVPDDADIEDWRPESWSDGIVPGAVADGVVVSSEAGSATVRVGEYRGRLDRKAVAWTDQRRLDKLLKPGDVIRVRVVGLLEDGAATLSLEQEPQVEAALIAIDPRDGEIRALVGGFDFGRSEFDRAVQARRQTGSAFKPFVFAAAFAHGWTPAQRILDEPTVFLDTRTLEPYQPENFGNKYYGQPTLREALEKSVNISTVKLLMDLGYDPVIQTARRLGISSPLQPYPSLALGSFETTLLELTAAYGAFANQGVWVEPHWVREVYRRDGSLLEQTVPRVSHAVTPQVAYLMNRMLAGVISDGTGRAAARLDRPLAGKTGTTDDYADAWFVGYGPDLVVGVWVGFDTKKSLGSRETGALAALPIWQGFMEEAHRDRPPVAFPRPPGIVDVAIDRHTGRRANPAAACSPVLAESFLRGSEPAGICSRAAHALREMPYALQRYELNDYGELVVPASELERLRALGPAIRVNEFGLRLEVGTADGRARLPIVLGAERDESPLTERLRERLAEARADLGRNDAEEADRRDPDRWRAKDGGPVTIRLLR